MNPTQKPRRPISDFTVWDRAAAHYRRIAHHDRRPGIRIWAADRAAECTAHARRAQRDAA